jgi:hypothetical protein
MAENELFIFNATEAVYYAFDKIGGIIPVVGDILSWVKMTYLFWDVETWMYEENWQEAKKQFKTEGFKWAMGKVFFDRTEKMNEWAPQTLSLWQDHAFDFYEWYKPYYDWLIKEDQARKDQSASVW